VLLAGQSSKVPVQHQHERSPAMVGRAPPLAGVIDELEVG